MCIRDRQEKSKHIPFRNSKLTHLLADSLGGNSKTFMFVNVNPASDAASESLCSLKFAERVRRVELGKASGRRVEGASLQELNAARANEERVGTELRATVARNAELENEKRQADAACAALEAELARERESQTSFREAEKPPRFA